MTSLVDRLSRALKVPRFGDLAKYLPALAYEQARAAVLALPRYAEPRRLPAHGHTSFSQSDEDGILAEIFRRIGEGGRRFLEIGAGDGAQNNTLNLVYGGWSGLWVEGSGRKCALARARFPWAIGEGRLAVVESMVTRETIAGLVAQAGPLDLFSIDIDGIDWHVVAAIPQLDARVIVVEYNPKFPPPTAFVVPYNAAFAWAGDDHFGASLAAWVALLEPRGYRLVGCTLAGINAFFVRADLAHEDLFHAPFDAATHYEPARHALVPKRVPRFANSYRASLPQSELVRIARGPVSLDKSDDRAGRP